MRRGGFVVAVLLMAGACSGGEADAPAGKASAGAPGETAAREAGEATQAALLDETVEAAEGSPSGGREVKVSNALFEFGYAYPDAAGAIPGLRAMLDRRLDEARASLSVESRADQNEAKKGGFPYRPHANDTTWKVVTELPGWLSLSSEIYVYTGGAHGMSAFDSLLWDKQAGAAREPLDLFTSSAALRKPIQRPFCNALDREREKRRGGPVRHGADDMFSDCINPLESTLILGSSNGRTFDRIGILVAPYAAGPYAEGTYEITLPVTQAVLDAVKPAYRASFSIGREAPAR
ncbi:hypothetical protein GCM10011494_13500 [Novosphingobium endophyticum]|uniref:Deacetylase PdaC domain-containing protein n=1 Tax=Novosphingobium endophyticum TaxID=1955250 RepID=A0A916TQS5_9SPHN|nr:DUF4163 domain-containing protein [Novosphingobium endophyticum]GGB96302.1 hypothetical protein GCM10011494_13500 [Novosphingobium endophyticum]